MSRCSRRPSHDGCSPCTSADTPCPIPPCMKPMSLRQRARSRPGRRPSPTSAKPRFAGRLDRRWTCGRRRQGPASRSVSGLRGGDRRRPGIRGGLGDVPPLRGEVPVPGPEEVGRRASRRGLGVGGRGPRPARARRPGRLRPGGRPRAAPSAGPPAEARRGAPAGPRRGPAAEEEGRGTGFGTCPAPRGSEADRHRLGRGGRGPAGRRRGDGPTRGRGGRRPTARRTGRSSPSSSRSRASRSARRGGPSASATPWPTPATP